jgi:hypothetical protein
LQELLHILKNKVMQKTRKKAVLQRLRVYRKLRQMGFKLASIQFGSLKQDWEWFNNLNY